MSLFRLDRTRRSSDNLWLEWKIRLFAIGAALAMAGMILGMRWLTTLAIPILLAGALLRFLPRGAVQDEASD